MAAYRWQVGLVSFLAVGGAIAVSGNYAFAQQSNIVPDNTLGAESSVIVPNYLGLPIEAISGGAERGQNLFHSFQEFNVNAERGAYFYSPSAAIKNILARVTGANLSEILGTLGTFGESNPNLFLMNPNGIIFGPDASLDVGGSFVATTSNAVRLGSTGVFSASEPATSNLLTVNPSALFFNALSNQAEIINRSTANTTALGISFRDFWSSGTIVPIDVIGLQVLDNQSLSLVGGDVSLDGGILSALEGQIELGGLAGIGIVDLNFNDGNKLHLNFPAGTTRADVSLLNGAIAAVFGDGGSIAINARKLDILGGSLLGAGIIDGSGSVSDQAGDITLDATEAITIGQSSEVANSSNSNTVGNNGNININARSLSLTDGAELNTSIGGHGNAGSVFIQTDGSVSLIGSGTGIFSNIGTGAVGNSGNINITAGSLSLSDGARLQASVLEATDSLFGGRGTAGSININARDAVTITGVNSNGSPSAIVSDTRAGAVGRSGNINIHAGSLSLSDGAGLLTRTSGEGDAGSVFLQAESLSIDGALVITSTFGKGNAGSVALRANGSISLANSLIFSDVNSTAVGQGGDINIQAGSLSLADRTQLSASTFGKGDAARVFLQADDFVAMETGSTIFNNVERGAIGSSGGIDIKARSLSLSGDAQILAATSGQGNAGNIFVQTNGFVSLVGNADPSSPGVDTGISSRVESEGVGNGGDITIDTSSLSLTGSQITASTFGVGNGGRIFVQAEDSVSLLNGSGIFSTVGSIARLDGGEININARELSIKDGSQLLTIVRGVSEIYPIPANGTAGDIKIDVRDTVTISGEFVGERNVIFSGIASSVDTEATGKGGNISIKAGELSLTDTAVVRSALDLEAIGEAGDIDIQVGSLSLTDSGIISSTFGRGKAGNISVQAEDTTLLVNSGIGSFVGEAGIGEGGKITISAGSLFLFNGAQISSNTFGQGSSGSVDITVRDNFTVTGVNDVNNDLHSGVFTDVGNTGAGKGGDINITASSLSLNDGAEINAGTFGQGNAGKIFVQAEDLISLANRSGIFTTVQSGAVGNGGDIDIQARSLSLTNGSQLQAIVFREQDGLPGGQGEGGNIRVNVTDFVNLSGVSSDGFSSGLLTSTERGAIGQAGNITVDTAAFHVADGAVVNAQTLNSSDGGNITINANTFEAVNGGQVLTVSRTSGNAGSITLNVANDITLSGSDPTFTERFELFGRDRVNNEGPTSGLFAQATADGNAGDFKINTLALTVQDGAKISASTTSGVGGDIFLEGLNSLQVNNGEIFASTDSGQAGSLSVNAAGFVELSGEGGLSVQANGNGSAGSLTINTPALTVRDGAEVSALTAGSGQGGTLTVTAPEFVTLSRGRLSTQATGEGNAGDLTINTPALTVQDGAGVSSSTTSGVGGDITLIGLNSLQVNNGGQISASTQTGRAGSLNVSAADAVELSGQGSGLFARADNGGTAGDLTINTWQFTVQDGAEATVSSEEGQAGNLTARANSLRLDRGNITAVTGKSQQGEEGANINLQVQDLLLMGNESRISADALEAANGGNINIDTDFLIALPAQGANGSDIRANAVQGNGGRLEITAQGILGTEFRPSETSLNDITASSEFGSAGVVTLNTPDVDLQNSLTELAANFASPDQVVVGSCLARRNVERGSFTVTGTGGLPSSPYEAVSGRYAVSSVQPIQGSGNVSSGTANVPDPTAWKPGAPIKEAQGMVATADGRIILGTTPQLVAVAKTRDLVCQPK